MINIIAWCSNQDLKKKIVVVIKQALGDEAQIDFPKDRQELFEYMDFNSVSLAIINFSDPDIQPKAFTAHRRFLDASVW